MLRLSIRFIQPITWESCAEILVTVICINWAIRQVLLPFLGVFPCTVFTRAQVQIQLFYKLPRSYKVSLSLIFPDDESRVITENSFYLVSWIFLCILLAKRLGWSGSRKARLAGRIVTRMIVLMLGIDQCILGLKNLSYIKFPETSMVNMNSLLIIWWMSCETVTE